MAATRVQAAFRGRKARKAHKSKGASANGLRDFAGRLEPQLTIALSLVFGLQWDEAVLYQIGVANINAPGLDAVNAVATTLLASILTFILTFVREGHSPRSLSLINQSLQVLVGWMWKSLIQVTDVNIVTLYLSNLTIPNRQWAQFGYVTGFALVWAPLFTLLVCAVLHPTRASAANSFAKSFTTLLLGAGSLVLGFSWHLAVVHLSLALVEEGLQREGSRAHLLGYALAAAIIRSIVVTLLSGLIKAYSPFAHASKIAKPPKREETFGKSFRDRSVFLGANMLIYLVAFSWFSAIEALAVFVHDEQQQWGAYIVLTVLAFIFLLFAMLLAWRGSATAKCCARIKFLGHTELLLFGSVPILLGWCLQGSYILLILRLAPTPEVAGIAFWVLGVLMLVFLSVVIIISAACTYKKHGRAPPRPKTAEVPVVTAVTGTASATPANSTATRAARQSADETPAPAQSRRRAGAN